MIAENLKKVEENILSACKRSGRERESVCLVAVSKTKPVSDVQEAIDCGIADFGENKVQELCDKYEVLPKDLHWHMIGHLQRNKVKYLPGKTCLIHSVDSYRLAEEIEKQYAKAGMEVDILIEVNVAMEESKYGLETEEVTELVKSIAAFPHLHIKGLMTIAPYTEDAESNRTYFRKLRQLSVDIAAKNIDNVDMTELSMGMTGDYEVAIEEGATIVRVGTGIFGDRSYSV